jgi:hypothetical protein
LSSPVLKTSTMGAGGGRWVCTLTVPNVTAPASTNATHDIHFHVMIAALLESGRTRITFASAESTGG